MLKILRIEAGSFGFQIQLSNHWATDVQEDRSSSHITKMEYIIGYDLYFGKVNNLDVFKINNIFEMGARDPFHMQRKNDTNDV